MIIATRHRSRRRITRRGFSLIEVTVGSMMAALVVMMASTVAVDVARHMAANIRETQVTAEARMAIESLRRDFSGACPDVTTGDRSEWRLVGRIIPNAQEIRLCFDADQDATADWISPDRVITYTLSNGQLIRSDQTSGNVYTVARHVDDVSFVQNGSEIEIDIDFEFGDYTTSYSFLVSDVL